MCHSQRKLHMPCEGEKWDVASNLFCCTAEKSVFCCSKYTVSIWHIKKSKYIFYIIEKLANINHTVLLPNNKRIWLFLTEVTFPWKPAQWKHVLTFEGIPCGNVKLYQVVINLVLFCFDISENVKASSMSLVPQQCPFNSCSASHS